MKVDFREFINHIAIVEKNTGKVIKPNSSVKEKWYNMYKKLEELKRKNVLILLKRRSF